LFHGYIENRHKNAFTDEKLCIISLDHHYMKIAVSSFAMVTDVELTKND